MGNLLYIIAVILVIIWVAGLVSGGTHFGMGNAIHILIAIAIVAVLLRVIRGGRI